MFDFDVIISIVIVICVVGLVVGALCAGSVEIDKRW